MKTSTHALLILTVALAGLALAPVAEASFEPSEAKCEVCTNCPVVTTVWRALGECDDRAMAVRA